jgi:hypothetical protein
MVREIMGVMLLDTLQQNKLLQLDSLQNKL